MLLFNQFIQPTLFYASCCSHLCLLLTNKTNTTIMKRTIVLAAFSVVLFSCGKDDNKSSVQAGPEVAVHHGKSWSWIHVDGKNKPLEVGITINEAALNSVPVGQQDEDGHDMHENSFLVPLPALAKEVTPFKTIMLDWNPAGHPPADIYTLPHFDLHFYMVSKEEIMNMTDMDKLEADPASGYIPANHLPGPGVPMMGKHWIDPASPEMQPGGTFSQTFLYGSYDSKVVFYEPMITLDFLKNTTHFERTIPQPAKYQQAGYYPTKMKVLKRGGATNIILTDFVQRQAS
jgi:hypothetical protein